MDPTTQPEVSGTPLTMQIVLRRDLLDAKGWGVGPLVTQAAHATAAVLHEFRALETTQAYLSDLKNMRKVTLQVPDEESLRKLEKLLNEADPAIGHYLWIEQPENVATCLALAPNDRGKAVRKVLDKSGCQLWR